MRRALLSLAISASLVAPAAAQDDDRGYLTALLEDNLSGVGREVTITGFAGALSSRASIDSLTIADDQGVWITLNGVVLDWSRSALLSGQVEVSELSAREIILARAPVAADTAPSPEAGGFTLPDLPVSVNIGRLAADRIVLGESLLGEQVEGRLEAAMSLAGGEGQARILLERTDDGPESRIALNAGFVNETGNLTIDLVAQEAAGGIAARLIGLPGEPATDLTLRGSAPLDDFRADLRLAADGQDRLSGTVALRGDGDGGNAFDLDVGGNLAPLFLPEYAEFFGPEIRLVATGRRGAAGDVSLESFDLQAQAIDLSGEIDIASDGLPQRFDIDGRLGLPDGSPVLLPLSGEDQTRLRSAVLSMQYDAAQDEGWHARAVIDALDRADFDAARLSLDASGRIARLAVGATFGATVDFAATGLAPADPELARALGPDVTGKVLLWAQEGTDGLRLPRVELAGDGYGLRLSGQIEGLESAIRIRGRADARVDDMTRLSGLAGRPLGGAARLTVAGSGSALGGDFDLTATVGGDALSIGQPQADALLAGRSSVRLDVRRDATGTKLDRLDVSAGVLTADAAGRLSSTGSDLSARLSVSDLSALGAGLGGALAGEARLTGTPEAARITLDATGSRLSTGQPQADRLLAGDSTLAVALTVTEGEIGIETARLRNPQLTFDATGTMTEAARRFDLSARLANLALLAPEFPGPVTVQGTATEAGQGFDLNLAATGPGGIDARLAGRLAPDGTADLTLRGSAEAALADPFLSGRLVSGPVGFDLALRGPVALRSLSGDIRLTGGRIADPNLFFALQDVAASARLAGGSARVDATAQISSGGGITAGGTVGLTPPFPANLTLGLSRAVLRDPQLFETVADGQIGIDGPLAGGARIAGRIVLDGTELQIPSSGIGGLADLPDLRHVAEPAEVRATRARAGLLGIDSAGTRAGGGRPFPLDLTISAPSRIFIRGRGLDAELGGELVLRGTTANVIPSGAFSLVRGRLDILGRRLNLTEASLALEGNFIPTLGIAATTESDGIATSIRIDGPATEPRVSFTSSPELPEEEVLSRLLFGRDLQSLSPLQAAQLANAVATLAGRGGVGIMGRLRQGFGLDELDIRTADDGTASLTAGKYLAENLYSEVSVGADGKTKINLNLDLTDSVTVRGSAQADGETGIGIFFEKDY
jgi:translocation and assembly module TamB